MEKIKFTCPHCQKHLSAPDEYAGRKVKCPKCQQPVVIPEAEAVAVAEVEEAVPQPSDAAKAPATEKPAPPSSAEPSGQWEGFLFGSDTLGYTFALPTDGWTRYPAAAEAELDADVFLEHADIGAIKFVISEWKLEPEELLAEAEDNYRSEVKQFNLVGSERTTVAGCAAKRVEYMGILPSDEGEEGQLLKFVAWVFVKDRCAYQIIAMSAPATFSRLKKEAAAAVASFSFDPDRARQWKTTRLEQSIQEHRQVLRKVLKRTLIVTIPLAACIMFFGPQVDMSVPAAIVIGLLVLVLGSVWTAGWQLAFRARVGPEDFEHRGCQSLGCVLFLVLPLLAPFELLKFFAILSKMKNEYARLQQG